MRESSFKKLLLVDYLVKLLLLNKTLLQSLHLLQFLQYRLIAKVNPQPRKEHYMLETPTDFRRKGIMVEPIFQQFCHLGPLHLFVDRHALRCQPTTLHGRFGRKSHHCRFCIFSILNGLIMEFPQTALLFVRFGKDYVVLTNKLFCMEWKNQRKQAIFNPEDNSWKMVPVPVTGSLSIGFRFGILDGMLLLFLLEEDPGYTTLLYDPNSPPGFRNGRLLR